MIKFVMKLFVFGLLIGGGALLLGIADQQIGVETTGDSTVLIVHYILWMVFGMIALPVLKWVFRGEKKSIRMETELITAEQPAGYTATKDSV